jgi:hypothetical protein
MASIETSRMTDASSGKMPERVARARDERRAQALGVARSGSTCASATKYRAVEEAVGRAGFAPPDERLVALLSVVAAALGILSVVVLLTES